MTARLSDWQTYHEWVEDQIGPDPTILEIGCGRGDLTPFPWCRYPDVHLIGLDPDPLAAANLHISRLVPFNGGPWRIPPESVDLVICRYVLEHIAEREELFANLRRVMRPGARFVFLTPNLWHPAVLISKVLPTTCKQRILRWTMGADEQDLFPTHYQMNTARILRSLADRWDFSVERLVTHEFEPCKYLDEVSVGFGAFYAYFRLMSVTGLGRLLGASILAEFRKHPRPLRHAPARVEVLVKMESRESAACLLPARLSK